MIAFLLVSDEPKFPKSGTKAYQILFEDID